MISQSKSRRDLYIVLAIALVARLLVLWLAVARQGATWLYSRGVEVGFVANSLLSGHGFASPFGGDTGPTALIAPGYPLLVAGVFHAFGTYSRPSAIIIMLGQVALNLATIALMMRLTRSLAGRRAAFIAGTFWACWLPFLWMPTIFWETSLSAFMLLGMLTLAIEVSKLPTRRRWLCFGILCGVACLINMALMITLSGIFVWLMARSFRTQRISIALAACLFVLVYSLWPLRNAKVFHAFIPLRTTVGLELRMGNHDGSSGYLEESLFPIYNKVELQEYTRVGEVAYDHEKSAAAHTWISSHRADFATLTILRAFRYWIGSGSRNGSPVFILGAFVTSSLGLLGLWWLYKSGERALAALFAIPLLCFPLPYYITHAEFRYRLVIDPLLTVLSAYAIRFFTGEKSPSAKAAPIETIDQDDAQLVA